MSYRLLLTCFLLTACSQGASPNTGVEVDAGLEDARPADGDAAVDGFDDAGPFTSDVGPRRHIELTASDEDFANPARGFYAYAGDLTELGDEDFEYLQSTGVRLIYAPMLLAPFRTQDISSQWLELFRDGLDRARARGLKVILRFAYNYPESETEYRSAQDAALAQIERHISQLAPILEDYASSIAYLQAGFIGAWGEWHTSSNGLDEDEGKLRVRDALLEALPDGMYLQVRYPGDLIKWFEDPLSAAAAFSTASAARVGMHNDCFLASETDVGTYDPPDKTDWTTAELRAYVRQMTEWVPFGGETCSPEDEADPTPRMTCEDILREGAEYHLSYLNQEYFEGFLNRWRTEGCYEDVSRTMGYRFELRAVDIAEEVIAGEPAALSVAVANVGWSRVFQPYRVQLILRPETGTATVIATAIDPLWWSPGRITRHDEWVMVPEQTAPGRYEVCLAMRDPAPDFDSDARYSVRWANAEVPASHQHWDSTNAEFCFATISVTASEQ